RITYQLIKDMNETCKQNRIQFIVLIIPTKEMVFSDYLERDSKIPLSDTIQKLITNERLAEAETFRTLEAEKIPYVYPLAQLKASIDRGLYARTASDMHPGKNGYEVIGKTVADYLKSSNPQALSAPTN